MENQRRKSYTLLGNIPINESMESGDVKFYLRKRYLVVFLICVGNALMYLLRINLSIGIVDMTSEKSVTIEGTTLVKEPDFNFSPMEKGVILSSFAWGFFVSPLGALLSTKIGGVTTYGISAALTGLITMFTPFLMAQNFYVYLVARIFEGVFESFAVASTADVFFHWTSPRERSRLIGSGVLGITIGTMLSYPICGTIALHFGWKAVFYVTGGATIVWYVIWFSLLANTPAEDRLILRTEKKFLCAVNGNLSQSMSTYPWKQILMSKPVWAYMNDRFVEAWSTSFLVYCLPVYIKDVHDVNIQDIGFISAIPHFCAFVSLVGGSIVADHLRNGKRMSITNVHKLFLTVAQLAAVILLVVVALWKNFVASIVCLSLFRLLFTICLVPYSVIPVDLAGRYGSAIMGLGVMCVSLSYTLNPIIIGFMVKNHSAAEWSRYFLLLSLFNLWGGFFFYKFGSGDMQPWAVSRENDLDVEYSPQKRKVESS